MYFKSILLYFATMLASGCIENQYSQGEEKVVINAHFKHANLLAVGDTTCAYFICFMMPQAVLESGRAGRVTLGKPLLLLDPLFRSRCRCTPRVPPNQNVFSSIDMLSSQLQTQRSNFGYSTLCHFVSPKTYFVQLLS